MKVLHPIMCDVDGDNPWSEATWVGQVDVAEIDGTPIHLEGARQHKQARLLVWQTGRPRGFIELPVREGQLDGEAAGVAVGRLPKVRAHPRHLQMPPVSVVVCTRDRPAHLRVILESLTQLNYPAFEIVVVDNNPDSGITADIVTSCGDDRVRLAEAPHIGLSKARNVGIAEARHDIVAFTDDDVTVDRSWLTNLVVPFVQDQRVGCVCGLVPSAQLATPAQSYFDRRVGWARRCDAAVYDLRSPPQDDALFPLRVAEFGTGANFAVRRSVALELGGFDEGLGIGSPAGGGEDIDFFVRVLLADHSIAREPSAVVWHRHRETVSELDVQIRNYGLGLGAWIGKLLMRPQTAAMVIRRIPTGLRHLRGVTAVNQSDTVGNDASIQGLDRRELRAVCSGPAALIRARLSGRRSTPLRRRPSLRQRFAVRRAEMFGGPADAEVAQRLAVLAAVTGLFGMAGSFKALPAAVLLIFVGAYLAAGPGSLMLSWFSGLPKYALAPLIPVVSVAACTLAVLAPLLFGWFNPTVLLLALTTTTFVGAAVRVYHLASRAKVAAP